jgi:hypothetical protein
MANEATYKLLRNSGSPETVLEGAKDSRGGRDLKAMLERHEARAMMLNETKTLDTSDLGLSEDEYQGVSFTPGTFVEARRFVSTSKKSSFFSLQNLSMQKRNSRSRNRLGRNYHRSYLAPQHS